MKTKTGIWLDSTEAFIIKLSPDRKGKYTKEEIRHIESDIETTVHHDQHEGDKGARFKGGGFGNQNISTEKKIEERKKHQIKDYIQEIITNLDDSDTILIFGPSEIKKELEKIILKNYPIVPKIKVQTSDKMTQNQMVAYVKKFYQ